MKLSKSSLLSVSLILTSLTLSAHSLRAEANPQEAKARFEKLVLHQLNLVRTDPQGYAEFLATRRARYQANKLLLRPEDVTIRTKEGVSALDEAIRALRAASPVIALAECDPLSQAARNYAAEQARTGAMGHYGRGGSTPFSRMSQFGAWRESAGENIMYGSNTAENVVYDLIVDDGERNRGHRTNILNGNFRVVGIGYNQHPKFRSVCVMEFAGAFDAR